MPTTEGSIGRQPGVTLRKITRDNLRDILRLEVSEAQTRMVAPNELSLAQASFHRVAWYRAIYEDEAPVGFIMLHDDPVEPRYFLWRLMIDQHHQHRGLGRQAVALLVDYVKTRPEANELLVSHVEGPGNPGPFYRKVGFEYTGELLSGELVMRMPLEPVVPRPADPPTSLTHVVLFKLQERTPAALEEMVAVLRSMEGKIPQLLHIEVGADVVQAGRSYDVALITRFAHRADMEAYQVHPIHQEVASYTQAVSAAVISVDYEAA